MLQTAQRGFGDCEYLPWFAMGSDLEGSDPVRE